jgi:hypothetical protein
MLGQGLAQVPCGRGAGEAQADTPRFTSRHQHQRIQPAGQRLGLAAETLVDETAPLLAQEDAGAVGAVVELKTRRPPPAGPDEQMPAG